MKCSICNNKNARQVVYSCLHSFDLCENCSKLDVANNHCISCLFEGEADDQLDEDKKLDEEEEEVEPESESARLDEYCKSKIAEEDKYENYTTSIVRTGHKSDALSVGDIVFSCTCGECPTPEKSVSHPYGLIKAILPISNGASATVEWDNGVSPEPRTSVENINHLLRVKPLERQMSPAFKIGDKVRKITNGLIDYAIIGVISEFTPRDPCPYRVKWKLNNNVEYIKFNKREELILVDEMADKRTEISQQTICNECHKLFCCCNERE